MDHRARQRREPGSESICDPIPVPWHRLGPRARRTGTLINQVPASRVTTSARGPAGWRSTQCLAVEHPRWRGDLGESDSQSAGRPDAAGRACRDRRKPRSTPSSRIWKPRSTKRRSRRRCCVIPAIHRLNRSEYGNAIRDLFALDVDVSALLPPDEEAYGFDNNATVLNISTSLMERYLSAAWKISSLAVASPRITPSLETFRVRGDLSQHDHVPGLPMGTRGGITIHHYFPVDGEYVISPRLYRETVNIVRGLELEHDLEVTLDGQRIVLARFGGPKDEQANYLQPSLAGDEMEKRFQKRLKITAGPHTIGVAFLKKSSATTVELLQPFERERLDPITPVGIPELDKVTIEGPFNATRSESAPSRQKVFTCSARVRQRDEARVLRRRSSPSLARRAYRGPVSDADMTRLARLLLEGARERRRLRRRHRGRAALPARASAISLSRRAGSRQRCARGSNLSRSAISSSHRGCRSSSGAAFRTRSFWRSQRPGDCRILPCSSSRSGACSRTSARARWAATSPGSGCICATCAVFSPTPTSSRTSITTFVRHCSARRSCSSRASSSKTEPVTTLLNADYTFLNERLARHYGVPNMLRHAVPPRRGDQRGAQGTAGTRRACWR